MTVLTPSLVIVEDALLANMIDVMVIQSVLMDQMKTHVRE